MKIKHIALLLAAFVSVSISASAQSTGNSGLFDTLKARDAVLFDRVFNKCETNLLDGLIAENFEFYHDQSGETSTKKDFIKSIADGICKLNYKPRRELVAGSLRVFPMYDKGKLYAAIQTGEHRFFATEKDKAEYLTSTAKFTHLWKLENGEWKLARVLSYDHQSPKEK